MKEQEAKTRIRQALGWSLAFLTNIKRTPLENVTESKTERGICPHSA